MEKFCEGTHHISLKQVPSCLMLKGMGSSSIKGLRGLVLESGFTVEDIIDDESYFSAMKNGEVKSVDDPNSLSNRLAALAVGTSDFGSSDASVAATSQDAVDSEGVTHTRIAYEDFFSVVAGRFLSDYQGRENKPRVVVWPGDVKRIQDQVDPSYFDFQSEGRSVPKNKIRFEDVKSWRVRLDFLLRRTHWGFKLKQLCKEEALIEKGESSLPDGLRKTPTTARMMRKVLKDFLAGLPDPRTTAKFRDQIYSPEREPVNRDRRARRLLEVLKTVDGIFAQRFCAFPHEEWTYEKYDLFVLKHLYELIADEFLDGQLTDVGRSIRTRYSSLKKVRGIFKRYSTREGDIANSPIFREEKWLRSTFLPLFREYNAEKDRITKTYLNGVLSQKRGAGKPGPLDKLQSKEKFLQTVTLEDDTSNIEIAMVSQCMDEAISKLPDHIFTGLATKGGVSVSNSATFEYSKVEFGTIQAIKDICQDRAYGIKALTICLETGNTLGTFGNERTEGTYIFFRCLEEVLSMTPEERAQAAVVLVDEPGKTRTVTKGVACLKVVLDFVNKICSIPLEKGFESSHSGMKSSNHAWNFFKDFEKETLKEILFKVKSTKEEEYSGSTRVTLEFEDVYMASTDYETATDYLSHGIAQAIAVPWMIKCGIPRILRNLVCEVAFNPRKIYFTGSLPYGKIVDDDGPTRVIYTKRGVLMGDPLTKVILHFVNIISRLLCRRIFDEDFHTRVFHSAQAFENFRSIILKRTGIDLTFKV